MNASLGGLVERVRRLLFGRNRRRVSFPRRPRPPAAFLLACVLWVALALWQIASISFGLIDSKIPDGLVSGEYELEVLEDAKLGSYGYTAKVSLVDAFGIRREVLASYSDDDMDGDPRLFSRQVIKARVSFSEFSESTFPQYAAKGLVARAKLTNARFVEKPSVLGIVVGARQWAREIFDLFDGKGSALLRAIVIGDRCGLDEGGLYDDVKTVGLAHMVAVSGAHLCVVSALVAAVLSRMRVGRCALSLVLCLFYLAYAAFTGFAAPVLRAGLMASIAIGSIWSSRRSSSLAALGVCVCLMLAFHPSNALSLSFFLSAASTAGIIILSPLLQAWFSFAFDGGMKPLTEAFSLTTAANIPIFPVTACVFSRIPILSPFVNALAAPMLAFLIGFGLAALFAVRVVPPVGFAMLSAACAIADGFCASLSFAARIPFSSLPCSMGMAFSICATVVLFGFLWAVWPRPSRVGIHTAGASLTAILLAVFFIVPSLSPDEIIAFDVGQGDAILVKSQGHSLLVDTGNQDSLLAAALGRQGVVHLDGVVITHHDDDHCASLDSLSANIAASKVYVSAPTLSCGCSGCVSLIQQAQDASGADAVGLTVGDVIRVGAFSCRVVWPQSFSDEGGNVDSLCLLVSRESDSGQWRILLTGDAEAEQLKSIAQDVGHVDVLKAAHHGSKTGMDDAVADGLSPLVALISCGKNNRYGHPSQSTLSALEGIGAEIFRTDDDGDIACVFSLEGMRVETQREREVVLE